MKTSAVQNYINHIAFVIDASSSMSHLTDAVVKVFDNEIKRLAGRSQQLDQETRVSVYVFHDEVECLIFDKDVLRLPSLASLYDANGMTALIDGTLQAITDLKQTAQMYGDHSFVIYVLTDGQENRSNNRPAKLAVAIEKLEDNWTIAALVPDALSVGEAKQAGFSKKNIVVWDATSSRGVEEVGRKMATANDSFMQGRSQGIRGTRSLFTIDTSNLSSKRVNDNLESLKRHEYEVVEIRKPSIIKEVVEKETKKPYVKGSAFYQLTKPETVQGYKQICIRNKTSGYVYTGDKARKLLGLPDTDTRLKPEQLSKFDIFVQSTSVNRKLVPNTDLIILTHP